MSQRGQVTLFIILGIVLLFAVGLFFLFRSQIEEVDVRAKVYANPTSSLEAYVAQCMEDVTYEGLLLLGQQGGYIDLPPHIRFNPSLSIGSVPGSPLRTPLWGVEQTMPSMQEMEQELARFIQDDIMFCLQRMPIQVISEPEVRVEINQEDIMVFMDYHFEEIVDDVVLTSQHFVIVVPFSLPFIIETAEQLVRSLRQEKLLEIVTFDLMAGDEPYGNNHGVPLTGIRFSCQRPVWLERNVQMRIQEVLEANIPRIRVQNTNYVPFLRRERDYLPFATLSMQDFEEGRVPSNMPVDQYEFNHLFLDTGFSSEVARRGINVGFDYSSFYGMEFTVRPSRGGVMQGSLQEGGNQFLEFFCMYVYHFTYDLRFPIQASFIQEDAFLDGTPFVFNIGVPVILVSNLPSDDFYATTFSVPVNDASELCEFRKEEEVHINVINQFTGRPINNANVSLVCGRSACSLGQTRVDGNQLRLVTHLPEGCFGGMLRVEAQGYVPVVQQIQGEQAIDVFMKSVVSIPYRIELSKNVGTITPQPLRANQQAFITLQSEGFEQSFFYNATGRNTLDIINTEAYYNVTIFVYGADGVTPIGGYIGEVMLDPRQGYRNLVFHTYERLPHPRSGPDIDDLMIFLYNGTYKHEYGVSFS